MGASQCGFDIFYKNSFFHYMFFYDQFFAYAVLFSRLTWYNTMLCNVWGHYHEIHSKYYHLCSFSLQSILFWTLVLGDTYGASIWVIPELYGQSNAPQLEELISLKEHVAKLKWYILFKFSLWFLLAFLKKYDTC